MSWDYQNVNDWKQVAPISLTGIHQSPIELTEKVEKIYIRKSPVNFNNYLEEPLKINVRNTGHNIQLKGEWRRHHPFISGLCIESDDTFCFENAHIHWSSQNTNGTEHSINHRKFAAELHIVHYNSRYDSAKEALNHHDGLAVLGILFDVNDNACENPGMKRLACASKMLKNTGSKIKCSHPFDLATFIPNPIHSVYAYDGSLTTPPCSESVRWIVSSQIQTIKSRTMEKFREVDMDKHCRSNCRPLQPINDRVVKLYEFKQK